MLCGVLNHRKRSCVVQVQPVVEVTHPQHGLTCPQRLGVLWGGSTGWLVVGGAVGTEQG